ncbi:DUF47 domain-containing protein [Tumebacillus sp. ITR2]|uniref:DUF47 domain-containing protein n=1 Tax=Tumebacillus amylolyticus TaxID=2801339 RepID=A0ABS1J604_9BACL|nr:DUF47 family protein [Tumebacillus amylolyticus]MBL0385595.1 DUF47 domain-containing protein [Tumebacillus amylolyticus]
MLGFFKKNEEFFDMLNLSASNVHQGAASFLKMLQDFTDVEQKFDYIQEIEHKGDAITREVIEKINKTTMTPIDREDISAIAFTLDEILDRITAVADRCLLYRIGTPTPQLVALAKLSTEATSELVKMIEALRHLKYNAIKEPIMRVKQLEKEADKIYRHSVAELLNDESRNPIEILKWKEIYEKMEDGLDFCEDVSNLVEGVIIKHQ